MGFLLAYFLVSELNLGSIRQAASVGFGSSLFFIIKHNWKRFFLHLIPSEFPFYVYQLCEIVRNVQRLDPKMALIIELNVMERLLVLQYLSSCHKTKCKEKIKCEAGK